MNIKKAGLMAGIVLAANITIMQGGQKAFAGSIGYKTGEVQSRSEGVLYSTSEMGQITSNETLYISILKAEQSTENGAENEVSSQTGTGDGTENAVLEETGTGEESEDQTGITVTFITQNPEGEQYQISYAASDKTKFEIPQREGYNFTGWCSTEDGTGEFYKNPSKLTEDITLYGIWEEKPEGILIKEKKLYMGEKYQLVLKNAEGKLKWKSDNPKVAKVDKDGVVTAVNKGKTVITVTQYGKEYKCSVTVAMPGAKKAYGILLSQMDNHEDMTYILDNMDGKGDYELIVIDQLPVSIQNKEKTGTASYFDTTEEKTKKNIRFYRYKKGKVILMKEITLKKGVNLMKHRKNGRLMIMNLLDQKAVYYFIKCSGGKIYHSTGYYKGGDYRIAVVTRALDQTIKKDLNYTVPKDGAGK